MLQAVGLDGGIFNFHKSLSPVASNNKLQ